jgi:hypothetical protein
VKLWIRLDAALPRDPEVRELADRLGVKKAEAIGLLACAWFAIAEHRPSGDVSDIAPATLEDWAEYEPRGKAKRGAFASAFRDLFTRDGAVRGWKDRQGKLIERMEKDRKRKQPNENPSVEFPRNFHGLSAPTERDVTERDVTEEQTANFNIARGVLLSKLPEQYRPDLEAFLRSLGSHTRQLAWIRNLDAKLNGMHPPVASPEVVGAALRQLAANGEAPNWKRFEGYLRMEAAPPLERTNGHRPTGKTLAATQLIAAIRKRRNPMFPQSLNTDWQEGLSPLDVATAKAFGVTRILNDTNEGTLVSQLAKALEENNHAPEAMSA